MKFKDLIHKYKEGRATEEEIKIVEEELEKYEAIEDYYSEEVDMDFTRLEKSENPTEDSINLKKSVNIRLRKAVLKSLAIFTLVILGLFFILSPIIGRFYYNPAKLSVGENNSDMEFDLMALTDLNLPGYKLSSNVMTDSLGFGVYDVSFYRRDTYTEENKNISLRIKRGNRSETSENSFTESYINFMTIRNPDIISPKQINNQRKRVVDHIKKLSPVAYTSSYITFEEDLSMDRLRELEYKYPDIKIAWAGIRTSEPEQAAANLTGFSLEFEAGSDNPDKEKYPAFNFLDWTLGKSEQSSTSSIWAEGYELHYKSLLKYLIDRKEAVDTLFYNNLKTDYYQESLDYVEENGVKTYGVLVYANAEDLMEVIENEAIRTIELDRAMASKRYIH